VTAAKRRLQADRARLRCAEGVGRRGGRGELHRWASRPPRPRCHDAGARRVRGAAPPQGGWAHSIPAIVLTARRRR